MVSVRQSPGHRLLFSSFREVNEFIRAYCMEVEGGQQVATSAMHVPKLLPTNLSNMSQLFLLVRLEAFLMEEAQRVVWEKMLTAILTWS